MLSVEDVDARRNSKRQKLADVDGMPASHGVEEYRAPAPSHSPGRAGILQVCQAGWRTPHPNTSRRDHGADNAVCAQRLDAAVHRTAELSLEDVYSLTRTVQQQLADVRGLLAPTPQKMKRPTASGVLRRLSEEELGSFVERVKTGVQILRQSQSDMESHKRTVLLQRVVDHVQAAEAASASFVVAVRRLESAGQVCSAFRVEECTMLAGAVDAAAGAAEASFTEAHSRIASHASHASHLDFRHVRLSKVRTALSSSGAVLVTHEKKEFERPSAAADNVKTLEGVVQEIRHLSAPLLVEYGAGFFAAEYSMCLAVAVADASKGTTWQKAFSLAAAA